MVRASRAAVERAESIHDRAEQLRRHLGVVERGMRAIVVPFEAGRDDGAAEHGLPERDAAQRRRVEARERMERIALDARALDGRVQELQIEKRVVTDENRAVAIL